MLKFLIFKWNVYEILILLGLIFLPIDSSDPEFRTQNLNSEKIPKRFVIFF